MEYQQKVTIDGMNPYSHGLRVRNKEDFFPKGFSQEELERVYYRLTAGRLKEYAILESPTFEEVDSYYNPGFEDIDSEFIVEAVVIDKFAKTESKMRALSRVLGKYLNKEVDGGEMISPMAPLVGKPKKAGTFAYVTVQVPFSDGQTISIVFHSPEGDKKRIGPEDQIIAFRWLLNKRDITHIVAPEEGQEVSLETIGKRMAQLLVKNHAHFVSTQKEAVAEQKKLDGLKVQAEALDTENAMLAQTASKNESEAATANFQIASTQSKIEQQKAYNAKLECDIAALQAKEAAKVDVGAYELSSGEKQALQESDVSQYANDSFKKAGGYASIWEDEEKQKQLQDGLDAIFHNRIIGIRNALRERGWTGGQNGTALQKVGMTLGYGVKAIGAGKNVVGVEYILSGGGRTERFRDMLDMGSIPFAIMIDNAATGESVPEQETSAAKFESELQGRGFSQTDNQMFRINIVGSRNGKPFMESISTNYFTDESTGKVVVNAAGKTFKANSADTASNAFGKALIALDEALNGQETVAEWTAKHQATVDKFNVGDVYKLSRKAFVSPSFEADSYMEGFVVRNLNSGEAGGSMLPAIEFYSEASSSVINVRYDMLQEYLDTNMLVKQAGETDQSTTTIPVRPVAIATDNLPEGWERGWKSYAEPENNKTYAGPEGTTVSVTTAGENGALRVLLKDTDKRVIKYEDIADAEGANQKALEFMAYASDWAKNLTKTDTDTSPLILAPSTEQNGNPAKRAAKILYHHGLQERVMGEEDFIVRIEPKEGPNLIVDKAGTNLSIQHLEKRSGKVMVDQAVTFALGQDGMLELDSTAIQGPNGMIRGKDLTIAQAFTKSLIDQGLAKSGILKEGRGLVDDEAQPDNNGLTPEGETIANRVNRMQETEEKMRFESVWQKLMAANSAGVAGLVDDLSIDDAKAIIDRLNAAPGDNPAVRNAIYAKFPETRPQEEPQPATKPPAEMDMNEILPYVKKVKPFMGGSQLQAMANGLRGEEKAYFKEKFVEVANIIDTMPKTYEQDGKGNNAVVYLHYFKGGSDWWIIEKDMEEEQLQAFGLADLFGDGGEMGYISIDEITKAGAELDLHWTPKTLGEIKGIGRQEGTEDRTDELPENETVVEPSKEEQPSVNPNEAHALEILNSIINGEITDTVIVDQKLDEAATLLEQIDKMEAHDAELNAAADKLTSLLAEKAKEVK